MITSGPAAKTKSTAVNCKKISKFIDFNSLTKKSSNSMNIVGLWSHECFLVKLFRELQRATVQNKLLKIYLIRRLLFPARPATAEGPFQSLRFYKPHTANVPTYCRSLKKLCKKTNANRSLLTQHALSTSQWRPSSRCAIMAEPARRPFCSLVLRKMCNICFHQTEIGYA